VADELAAAGSLLMGQADEGRPIVLARGMRFTPSDAGSQALIRPRNEDMFR
jgi:coenzyme F420-0:L-glutamate ligase/coenzyme F420-1:gamma-L-glutamate ligase